MILPSDKPLILIADDDRLTRIALRTMLEKDGYHITEAHNGIQCLSIFSQQHPAMVLLDVNLSKLNGFNSCEEIRKLPHSDHTPIILFSESEDPKFVDHAFRVGATDYITKPIQFSVLHQRIRYLLKAHNSEIALRESEARYRLVINTLKEVIFQIDLQGQFTFLNSAWVEMTGFGQSESIGHNIISFIYPEDRPTFAQAFKALLQNKKNECLIQLRYLTQSNRVEWIEMYAQRLNADDGTLMSISGSLNNITERRGREQRRQVEQAATVVLAEAITLGEAIPHLLRSICQTLEWDYGELWLVDPQTNIPYCSENWYHPISEQSQLQPKQPLFALAAEFIQRIWAYRGPISLTPIESKNNPSPLSKIGLRSAFSMPILGGYDRLGMMVFFTQKREFINPNLLQRMGAIGSQVGEFWMRKQAEAEVQRQHTMLQSELKQAADYVRSLIPGPLTGPVSIQHHFVPSNQLGGDAFDYYWLDDDNIVFYLLDVSGHGVRSTLLSVSVLNVLRSQSLPKADFYQPQSVLERLNHRFQMNDQGEDYFTIWYGVYNRIEHQLSYASAGHPPALLLSPITPLRLLDAGGPPIGLVPSIKYTQASLPIRANNALYLFSDGVYEVIQPNGELWGFQNFIDLVMDHQAAPSSNLTQLLQKIMTVTGNRNLADDYSLMELRFESQFTNNQTVETDIYE